jgi:hypothetical protein
LIRELCRLFSEIPIQEKDQQIVLKELRISLDPFVNFLERSLGTNARECEEAVNDDGAIVTAMTSACIVENFGGEM